MKIQEERMSKRSKAIIDLSVSVIYVMVAVFAIVMFNNYILMSLPLAVRMIAMLFSQWCVLIVPLILMKVRGEKLSGLGFTKERLMEQILTGIILALVLSLILTVLPVLTMGKENIVGSHYQYLWQFIFDFIHKLGFVALMEEIIFRGYIYYKLLEIKSYKWLAILVSSLLFGLMHIFTGGIVQVIMTAVIGVILCLFREKISKCTILSLVIAHGLYDWLIGVWGYVF